MCIAKQLEYELDNAQYPFRCPPPPLSLHSSPSDYGIHVQRQVARRYLKFVMNVTYANFCAFFYMRENVEQHFHDDRQWQTNVFVVL